MLVNLIQGTKEWHEARRLRITATDATVIMAGSKLAFSLPDNVLCASNEEGACTLSSHPFRTMSHLWLEKKFGIYQEVSDYSEMLFEHGHEYEEAIINNISDSVFEVLEPQVAIKDWMLASLDGLSKCLKIGAEAKAPMIVKRQGIRTPSKALDAAMKGKIVDYYWVQMQWQFACVDELEVIHFGVRNPVNNQVIKFEVKRHEAFIALMIEKAKTIHDDIFNETEEWRGMDAVAREYAQLQEEVKAIESKMSFLKAGMLEYAQTKGLDQTHFSDVYISKNEPKKTVDFRAHFESLGLHEDGLIPFTKTGDVSWTVRVR